MQKLKIFLQPNKSKVKLFLWLFLVVQTIQTIISYGLATVDFPFTIGLPAIIYEISCGYALPPCLNTGFYPLGLLINIAIFYTLACYFKRNK